MSTDFENELRDLFREKAADAPLATPSLPASAPPRVLRRGRVHQMGTALGSAAVALILVVGSVAGLQRLLGGGPDTFGSGEYEVFERTATIEAFTVTSPSDTFLVNHWPASMQSAVGSAGSSETCTVGPNGNEVCEAGSETMEQLDPPPSGLPMFQLSTVDLGLSTTACGGDLPAEAAVLYVGLDYERAIFGALDPSIPAFSTGMDLGPEGDGPCGPGRYVTFTVGEEPFFAWIGLGADVTDEDRATVEAAYERLSAIEAWTPTRPEHVTPAYVIAGETTASDGPWRLEVRPGDDVEIALFVGGTSGRIDVSLGSEAVSWCCRLKADPTRAADLLFGAVQGEAAGVEFRPTGGGAIAGTILPLPPSLGPLDLDLFFIDGTGEVAGDVVAVGLGDRPTEPPVATDRAGEVRLNGSLLGQDWGARFTGAFADESACIRVTIDEAYEPLCVRHLETSPAGTQPSLHVWVTTELALFAGSVPWEVVDIRFTSGVGTEPPMDLQCTGGPAGWTDPDKKVCAIALPPEGSGTMQYLDANGTVLFEDGHGWGSTTAAAPPTAIDPVHGGTYWGVYAWLGPPGSGEANEVVGQLFDEHGVQAHQGELACDRGAAEALGTDAVWRVAVYFETRDEARAFALDAGLLGHEADPVVAEVTTVCLD